MPTHRARLATPADDALLRDCIRKNAMPGMISVGFETEPSFFDAITVQGHESQVVVGMEDDAVLIGYGIRSFRRVFVNGEPCEVGYLSSLRVNPEFRNRTFLLRGFKYLRELHEDGRAPFYVTTIIEDNDQARAILESGRAGMPAYRFLGTLVTHVTQLDHRRMHRGLSVSRASNQDMEAILRFMHMEGARKQFYPYYTMDDVGSPRLRGLQPEDFYIARSRGEIVGICARWDQEAFKQSRIVAYDTALRLARPLVNALASFTRVPRLPAEGELLHYYYAALPTVRSDDPDILRALLDAMAADTERGHYDYFTIGLMDSDPLLAAMPGYRPREYRASLYIVDLDEGIDSTAMLDTRTPYLELATM